MINGTKPKLAEGLVLIMDDGSQRKVLSWTPGAHGEVRCKTRKGPTGRWGTEHAFPRRSFWKDVDHAKT